MASSPFLPSTSEPGHGTIELGLLPPVIPVLEALSYQYPLKLISPAPTKVSPFSRDTSASSTSPSIVYTVFLLTYGGGLVAGDSITLTITLGRTTRLILLTQGSTKIFKSPSPFIISRQTTITTLHSGAALVYLPDPVQPFASSAFEQVQIYNLAGRDANLFVCDWVSEGRSSRGEKWEFWKYGSRNEVWAVGNGDSDGSGRETKRLLLRDNLVIDTEGRANAHLAARMDCLGVFGTAIVYGSLFATLAAHFLQEFTKLPRIGGRQWDTHAEDEAVDDEERRRAARVMREKADGLLWTAASLRGFVIIKFAAREVEGARTWLRSMIKEEGTVERCFGERALLCLR